MKKTLPQIIKVFISVIALLLIAGYSNYLVWKHELLLYVYAEETLLSNLYENNIYFFITLSGFNSWLLFSFLSIPLWVSLAYSLVKLKLKGESFPNGKWFNMSIGSMLGISALTTFLGGRFYESGSSVATGVVAALGVLSVVVFLLVLCFLPKFKGYMLITFSVTGLILMYSVTVTLMSLMSIHNSWI
jgi:hypothetical protein